MSYVNDERITALRAMPAEDLKNLLRDHRAMQDAALRVLEFKCRGDLPSDTWEYGDPDDDGMVIHVTQKSGWEIDEIIKILLDDL